MRHLLDLPIGEARRLLAGGAPVYLPVNPVEYHGPHLSLHNDRLVSIGMIKELHACLQATLGDLPLLLASDLEVGVDPCPGPGTRASAYRAVRTTVVEACERLADLGAQRVVLVTFHGSPLHNLAIQAGIEALTRRGVQATAPLNLALEDLIAGHTDPLLQAFDCIPDEQVRENMRRDVALDFHAGFLETSLALHYAPQTVDPDYRSLPPCGPIVSDRQLDRAARVARGLGRERLATELAFLAHGLGWYAVRPFPGYTGNPHLADVDAGHLFARAFVSEYTAHVLAVFEGGPSAPAPLPWMTAATLGGRVGGIDERLLR